MWHDKITCSIVGHKLNFWLNSSFTEQKCPARVYDQTKFIAVKTSHLPDNCPMTDCMLFAGLSPASYLAKQGLPRVFILASAKKERKLTYSTCTDGNKNFPFRHLYTSAGLILFPFFLSLIAMQRRNKKCSPSRS